MSLKNNPQLVLNVRLRDDDSFTNFLGNTNSQASGILQNSLHNDDFFILLHGGQTSGKSHLLHAACQSFQLSGKSVVSIPLAEHADLSPGILDGLDSCQLVCLDDLDTVFGIKDWELAVFDLYNRVQLSGGKLLAAVSVAPANLQCQLPDLLSRLRFGVSIALSELSDAEKSDVLIARAKQRGIELPGEVANYIMNRNDRNLEHLLGVLQLLDDVSLSAKRKLTIPFVKSVLGW
ncbi:MAG: DnaA regulatory inactivator Hda [Proteobacteria bacterium]|nr:MAG: DnaA regulatory inactivator Hda [Pseudomonadota bacterium]